MPEPPDNLRGRAVAPTTICLQIISYTCEACGFRWTHSEPILLTHEQGFRSIASPEEYHAATQYGGQLSCVVNTSLYAPICARCAPLGLHIGWINMKDLPNAEDYQAPSRGLRPRHLGTETKRTNKRSSRSSEPSLSDSALDALLGGKPQPPSDNQD
jgi:hypothetical protein